MDSAPLLRPGHYRDPYLNGKLRRSVDRRLPARKQRGEFLRIYSLALLPRQPSETPATSLSAMGVLIRITLKSFQNVVGSQP